VHGEQLVELLVRQELQAGQRQLGAHQQRHQAADEEEDEAGDAVHDADHLVDRWWSPACRSGCPWTEPRRERSRCLELTDWGRFGYQQILQKFGGSASRVHRLLGVESYPQTFDVGPGPTNCRI